MSINRAYSLLTIKAVEDGGRVISGIATTPTMDRVGDIVDPMGAKFASEMPLLLFHAATMPVGVVKLGKPTKTGIPFTASIPEIVEPGRLKERIDEAWQSVKAGLIKGVSIGFRAFEDGIEILKGGGLKFTKFEIMELSLVSIPANSEATIHSIKTFDAPHLAATGEDESITRLRDRSVSRVVKAQGKTMKTIKEQIAEFEATRAAKSARMNALMEEVAAKGETLDEAQGQEYETLESEVASIDKHLARLANLDKANVAAAKAVVATSVDAAAASRGGLPVITVRENRPAGVGFARAAIVQVRARLDQVNVMDVAKGLYPSDGELHKHFEYKAAVPAGTTTQAVYASPLVDQTNLASEFVEFLRPQTIIGRIPGFRRVPFNVRITGQTSGGNGYWVGEGAPKPLTSFAFNAQTLLYTKVAAIAVITEELARFSSPSAETLVRDSLAAALVERLDTDFIDPAEAGSTGVQPASITNGLVALSSAGTSADNVRTDLANLLSTFIEANVNPSGLVLIMPNTLALALSLMVNSLGQPEFGGINMNGGSLMGIPVVASQYAANQSGGGNLVIAVNASDIALADDGSVRLDASREASLQMLDNPTNNSATATPTSVVSMYQTNSIALRAERFINWKKLRSTAVVYMDDVNWASVGSPA